MRARLAGGLLVAVLVLLASPAYGHETKVVGPFKMTLGWGAEPAFSGLPNTVEVALANADGTPVADPAAALTAEVGFDDARTTLLLLPTDRPGVFRATIVPTRAGSYSFHIAGNVAGQTIDTTSICGAQSFDCVTDAATIQFPAKDPASGQLLARLDREQQRAARSADDATTARRLAIVAIAVAAAAIALTVRRSRRNA